MAGCPGFGEKSTSLFGIGLVDNHTKRGEAEIGSGKGKHGDRRVLSKALILCAYVREMTRVGSQITVFKGHVALFFLFVYVHLSRKKKKKISCCVFVSLLISFWPKPR